MHKSELVILTTCMEESFNMIDSEPTSPVSTSAESTPEVVFRKPRQQVYWVSNKESRAYVFQLFTCFYALLIVIGGIVLELANLIANDQPGVASIEDLILGVWLFGGSIIFIGFCAFRVYAQRREVQHKRRSLIHVSEYPDVLSNTSTGSLYLRIGCIVFGIIGVIYYGLIFVICILGWSTEAEDVKGECTAVADILNFMAAIFIFVQMWFVYCNGKIIFTGSGNVARFGLMHLTGTNLWMWLRYIIYEEVETISEIRRVQNYTPAPFVHPHHEHDHSLGSHPAGVAPSWEPYPDLDHHENHCTGVLCLFNGYNEFMYTCVVEYSLLCAGVAFVFWTNIEANHRRTLTKKRSRLTIDCSRTAEGLFAGFVFIIVTIISIAVFNAYSQKKELAQWIFSCTNLAFFLSSTAMCCFAFWRLKVLKFEHETEGDDASAELLDQILLVVGLMGELIFSIGGILSFVNSTASSGLAVVMLITNLLRLIQVSLQSGLILVASRLVLDENDPKMLRYKPGKQIITLLLMMNCAQFLMNVFEAQKETAACLLGGGIFQGTSYISSVAGVDEEIVRMYGSYYWAVLIRGCSPLTIFYRFHSSACFAEIWKKTFKVEGKHHHGHEEVELQENGHHE